MSLDLFTPPNECEVMCVIRAWSIITIVKRFTFFSVSIEDDSYSFMRALPNHDVDPSATDTSCGPLEKEWDLDPTATKHFFLLAAFQNTHISM